MRFLSIFIVFSILLVGCNFPVQPPSLPADNIETRVAATLTALVPTEDSQPIEPTSTNPVVVDQLTPTPSLEPSQTATIAPTPTPPNWKDQLGTPVFQDAMNTGDGWYLTDDDQTTIDVAGGYLSMTSINAIGWHGWSLNYLKAQDFYLEGTFKVAACSGNDRYGLVFRSPDYQKGYFLGITCGGLYGLLESDGTKLTSVTAFESSPDIRSGSNQINLIGVKVDGNQIAIYINDKLQKTVTDDSYSLSGVYGVFVAGYETPGFTMSVDQITLWAIE